MSAKDAYTLMCAGKVHHACKRDAQTVANARLSGRQRLRRGRPEFLRVYHCPHCNGWHITRKH